MLKKNSLGFVQEDHGLIKKIYRNLHVPIFEYFFVTARQYRYDLMCGLRAYGKKNGFDN